MPEIEPSELATLRTLRDVADKLSAAAPAVAAVGAAPAGSEVSTPPAATSVIDTTALALEVVSEKTGYPVEMLDLDMEMEAGLGIDSIKQVEILSELQERIPGMPEIEPFTSWRRCARSVTWPTSCPSPVRPWRRSRASTTTAAPPVEAGGPAVDTTALALEVVAEKTGYPVEMLDLDMEMEAGLGIDSIKQVEILSELQERVPGMPEIEPAELATLRTLRDVADKLAGAGAPSEVPAAPAAAERSTRRRARRRGDRHDGARSGGGGREDGLPGGDARPGYGDGGRAGHRLDQTGRDPVRVAGAGPRHAGNRAGRAGDAAHAA